jgi:hypothetical protein
MQWSRKNKKKQRLILTPASNTHTLQTQLTHSQSLIRMGASVDTLAQHTRQGRRLAA